MSASQARAYLTKANEYLDAAVSELEAGRAIAATSLAIHAAINSADAVTGARLGRRASSQAHEQVLPMLGEAGRDGTEVAKELARLLPLKTKAEYEADAIAMSDAKRAVERASRCVVVARRVIQD